jgi:DNA-binding PadR family transcriptional regulator
MSIRHSLLALLADRPTHGYGLKTEFEASTAGAWPLNVGQVYTTLNRLERDGLVEPVGVGEGDRQDWRITDGGRKALAEWYATPESEDPPARDALTLKVLLAASAGEVDMAALLQAQRVATMARLHEYTRHRQAADPERQTTWLLLLESLILKAEAEVKWIDLCEQRLAGRTGR